MKLKDKVAIITGGGGGLGQEIALSYANEGANIVLADTKLSDAEAVARMVRDTGRKCLTIRCNVSDENDVQHMIHESKKEMGEVDILINNAAIGFGSHPARARLESLTLKHWQTVMDVNLTGTFLCCKAILPSMKEKKHGIIINISSGMARTGQAEYAAYSASKAGVEAITRVLSAEVAYYDIRVNSLCPGAALSTQPLLDLIDTNPMPLLRPDVIRGIIIYLSCEDSVGISGQYFVATQWNEEHGLGDSSRYLYKK